MQSNNKIFQEDMLDFSDINRVRELRNVISLANLEISQISSPYLCDSESLHKVFGIYRAVVGEDKENNSYERKKFLMAVMYLFSPITLAGGKMRSGLRQKLASIMKVKNHTTISANLQDVLILYRNYRDFRCDVNKIVRTFIKK